VELDKSRRRYAAAFSAAQVPGADTDVVSEVNPDAS
jgi:hypothetical protein